MTPRLALFTLGLLCLVTLPLSLVAWPVLEVAHRSN